MRCARSAKRCSSSSKPRRLLAGRCAASAWRRLRLASRAASCVSLAAVAVCRRACPPAPCSPSRALLAAYAPARADDRRIVRWSSVSPCSPPAVARFALFCPATARFICSSRRRRSSASRRSCSCFQRCSCDRVAATCVPARAAPGARASSFSLRMPRRAPAAHSASTAAIRFRTGSSRDPSRARTSR